MAKPDVTGEYSDFLAWEEEIKRLVEEEGMDEDEAETYVYENPDYAEFYWEFALDDIWVNFVSPMIDKAKFTEEILIEGSNIGWRNRSGFRVISAPENAREFLLAFVPENTQFSLSLEYYKKQNVIEARLSHHDSPMGEFYNISLVENLIIEALEDEGVAKKKIDEIVPYHDEYSYAIGLKGGSGSDYDYYAWIEGSGYGGADVELEKV